MPVGILLRRTVDIVTAHVANSKIMPDQVGELIEKVFDALSSAASPVVPEVIAAEPAVAIRSSVKPDYIVCLEDGTKFKTLKRHLARNHNLTPEEYRAKWGLPQDYPMVAPSYSEKRRAVSLELGLGRKKTPNDAAPVPAVTDAEVATEAPDTAPAKAMGITGRGARKVLKIAIK